jgi:hypothetical protein
MILALVGGSGLLAAGQTKSSASDPSGPALLSCSPAPCVLSPTQVSPGPNNTNDAPIVADPSNPRNLLVGSNDWDCSVYESLGFYVSLDGGSEWNQVCMSSRFFDGQEYIPADGPILGYDRNGAAYIGGYYPSDGDGPSFAVEAFEKSSDGVNWTVPAPAIASKTSVPDYCWMTVDTNANSPYVDSVYVSCVMIEQSHNTRNQLVVSHSNDGGTTWQLANVAAVQYFPDTDYNTAMTVGKDGTVYLTWMYCDTPGPHACIVDGDEGYMVFSKSSDGGNTWSKPKLVAPVRLIYPVPNTQALYSPNVPAIGVDNSDGRNAGNLYVVMYNWTGTFMQVQVVRSVDGGATWSKPVPVAPGITHDQFLPWISVSPTGLVGVIWLDRRNDPNNVDYQAFAGISSDGGSSFQPNIQLTEASSDPNVGGLDNYGYNGATWDGPNYFLAAWMDQSNGINTQDVVGGIRVK